MSVILEHELQFVETPGGNATSPVATLTRGATEISVVRQRQRPGGTNPPHTHDREEVLTALAGSLKVTLGDRAQRLAAGDTVIIPAGTTHRIENAGDQPAEWLIIAPAGIRYFGSGGEEMFPGWAD